MTNYNKKQRKHTRSIFLNTDNADYVDADRKTFRFRIPPINIEDESLLYVKNTSIDYKVSGLSVKEVKTSVLLRDTGTSYAITYGAPPAITFISQDGKGTGASAVAIMGAVGLTSTLFSATTALTVVNGGSGYTGSPLQNTTTFTTPITGGQGASVLPTISTSTTGVITTTIPTIAGTTSAAVSGSPNERYLTFPYSGAGTTFNYTFTTTEPIYGSILVVGGGGSGGRGGGNGGTGGGGAGALIYAQDVLFPAGNFIVRVGKGGAPTGSSDDPILGNGGDSSINYNGVDIYLAKGGGGGASGGIDISGANGGSGGGGNGLSSSQYNLGGAAVSTNIPAVLDGNNGGNGAFFSGSNNAVGGGGGGAGSAGGNGLSQNNNVGLAGVGGAGLSINMTGTASFYAGGGGGGAVQGSSSSSSGGSGVGGNGNSSGVGGNGTASTGSGGGGGGRATGGVPNNGGSGGSGVVIFRYYINGTSSATGTFTAGTLTAGSGYCEIPDLIVPSPPPTIGAIFDVVPFTASTGTITGVPNVLNRTTNGYYNAGTFTIGFVNNPVIAQGFCSTNASGTITNIIISNSADNGFYSSSDPITIESINGILLGSGFGVGLAYTPTYSNGRAVSIIITNGGTGYGANLVDAPVAFSYPATPTPAVISGRTIVEGHLIRLVLGSGGAKYKNPTIFIDPVSISPPVKASFAPVYLNFAPFQGAVMLNHGRGYKSPPRVVIDQTFRNPTSTSGQVPLMAEMTPTYLVEPNYYYTIKAEGFHFNRTLYTNQDHKALPTIAICSTTEIINDEDYIELVLPAQVINDFTLQITERSGEGLDPNRNLIMLLEIVELDEKDSSYYESIRQRY
jgi:hypothetical protein